MSIKGRQAPLVHVPLPEDSDTASTIWLLGQWKGLACTVSHTLFLKDCLLNFFPHGSEHRKLPGYKEVRFYLVL